MELNQKKLTEITFHLIVDSAPNAVLLVNQEGKIAYVNKQCESLFGYISSEMIGMPVEMLIPEPFRKGHVPLRRKYMHASVMRRMGEGRELYGQRKDGTICPLEIGLNPLVLVDGTWVLATIIDISERKRAEDRFRKIVNSAPNAMILVNQAGFITLVNQQALIMFGYSEADMVGKKMEMLLPERYRGHHGALRDGFFANPQTRNMGVGRDLFARRKDGSEIPVEIGLNPVQTEEGIVAVASIIDITARREQEELRVKKDAAEAAYKAKGELLAIASHDLKNPLLAINGIAQLMLDIKKSAPNIPAQDIEFLQNICDASLHMSNIVKGILESEGLEQQGAMLDFKEVDLSALCTSLIRINEAAAMKKGILITYEIEPGVVVQGDKTRLQEAFDNYVSNAIKYSPGGKKVTVSLKKVQDLGHIEFGVKDEGPGLTEEDRSKLFGKFKRLSAKPTGGESSTGLGLSIVKAIIELHNGKVGCDSQPGQGAYFWARLPMQ